VPLLVQWLQPTPRPSFLAYIRGDAAAVTLWIAIGWIVGGFFEETLFRGFLLNRVERLLGGGKAALAIAIVAQAVLFGLLHLYGGPMAMAYATLFAVTHGVFYVLAGRNLWPLIVVHGTWDMVQIWGVYRS